MNAGASRIRLLDPARGPRPSPFAEALRSERGAAVGFLPTPPRTDAAWRALLERTVVEQAARRRRNPDGAAFAALVAGQVRLGRGPEALAGARALAAGEAVAVVTGQQPGLLGGPLLTFSKAAGAVHLARRLDALGGPRVVPVFWTASEDHDVHESDRAVVLGRDGAARGLSLGLVPDGRSLAHVDVPAAASDVLLKGLRELLPDTERAHAALALVERTLGVPYATWCLRSFLALFDAPDLVVFDPVDVLPEAPVLLTRLVRDAEGIVERVNATGRALQAAGLPAPLAPPPGQLPLFLREEATSPRRRVRSADAARVLAALERDPRTVSTDALGRVLVQNELLPVVAYVAGPTEIAYQAQAMAAAKALDWSHPLALPRPECTFVEQKVRETIEGFGLDVAAVLAEGSMAERPRETGPSPVLAALDAHVAAWPAEAEAALASGGVVGESLARARGALRAAWAKARRSIEAAEEGAIGRDRGRWARAAQSLFPRGQPQERVLSAVSLAARHGPAPLRAAWAHLDPLAAGHYLVELEGAAEAD